jgi:hypothetical protein
MLNKKLQALLEELIYEEVEEEIYTEEELEMVFEEMGLDTYKYTTDYLAEQMGFEILNEYSTSKKRADAANRALYKDIEDRKIGVGMKDKEYTKKVATYQKHDAGKAAGEAIAKARKTDDSKSKKELYNNAKKLIKIGKDSKKTVKKPKSNTDGKYLTRTTPGAALAGGAGAATAINPAVGLGLAGATGLGAAGAVIARGGAKHISKHSDRPDAGYNKKIRKIKDNTDKK